MDVVPYYGYVTSNVGDAIGPWLIRQMGHTASYVGIESPRPKVIVTGSILPLANGSCTVWGAGIADSDAVVCPSAKILAVRGPLSRIRALKCGAECPPVYGDPALLCPLYYTPEEPGGSKQLRPTHRLGLLPHFVDQERVFSVYEEAARDPDNVLLIDVLQSPEAVIRDICSCERIVSSSLHGLILAVAYGRSALWAKFSDGVLGDGTKFYDFFLSIGVDPYVPLDLRPETLPSTHDLRALVPLAPAMADKRVSTRLYELRKGLLACCPWLPDKAAVAEEVFGPGADPG